METHELIDLANSRMGIMAAFRLAGYDLGSVAGTGKIYCPFGDMYHVDGGRQKAMKVFEDDNSAWCFAGCGYFNPVKVLSMARDATDLEAAEFILVETKYIAPNFSDQWDALVAEEELAVDIYELAETLKVACGRMSPQWDAVQFDDRVGSMLSKCLSVLPKVHTGDEAVRWLEISKSVMQKTLGVD